MRLDLSRTNLFDALTLDQLRNASFMESFIPRLGFNIEALHEQPTVVQQNGGGLCIWQYPNQFSKYLAFLSQFPIRSYIEIGCRWGGTFVLTNEYFRKLIGAPLRSIAIDLMEDCPVQEYCSALPSTTFIKLDSHTQQFKQLMDGIHVDVLFIDGDHSYEGVRTDFELSKKSANIYVFHDIVSCACAGVVVFWQELKHLEKDTFDFYEFTDQYPDVLQRTGHCFLGIGVAVRKTFQKNNSSS